MHLCGKLCGKVCKCRGRSPGPLVRSPERAPAPPWAAPQKGRSRPCNGTKAPCFRGATHLQPAGAGPWSLLLREGDRARLRARCWGRLPPLLSVARFQPMARLSVRRCCGVLLLRPRGVSDDSIPQWGKSQRFFREIPEFFAPGTRASRLKGRAEIAVPGAAVPAVPLPALFRRGV